MQTTGAGVAQPSQGINAIDPRADEVYTDNDPNSGRRGRATGHERTSRIAHSRWENVLRRNTGRGGRSTPDSPHRLPAAHERSRAPIIYAMPIMTPALRPFMGQHVGTLATASPALDHTVHGVVAAVLGADGVGD